VNGIRNVGWQEVDANNEGPVDNVRAGDLPTIGIHTVDRAAAAGLRGIAVEAGESLILDREAVIARADEKGLFLVGFADT